MTIDRILSSSMRRRTLLAGLGASALIPSLAACTGGGGAAGGLSQPDGNVPDQYKDRTRIVVWTQWGGKNGETFKGLVDKYNESQTDIYLDSQVQNGSYDDLAQKLATTLQAKQAPDMFTLSADLVGGFFLSGILEPLDDYIGDDAINPVVVQSSQISGKLWRIPFAASTPILLYNKDIFSKAGLGAEAPATWSDFVAAAKELDGFTYNKTKTKMIPFEQKNGDYTFQSVLWNYGGAYSDGLKIRIAEAGSIEAGEMRRSLVRDLKMAYMAEAPATDFSNGLTATVHASSASITSVLSQAKFEVGAAPSPAEKENYVPCGGGGLSIVAGVPDERKQAAAGFLKFLCEPDNSATWGVGTGYIPITDAATQSQIFLDQLKKTPQMAVAPSQFDHVRRQDDIRMFVNTASDTISQGLQKLYTSGDTTEAVFKEVADALTKDAEGIADEFNEKVH